MAEQDVVFESSGRQYQVRVDVPAGASQDDILSAVSDWFEQQTAPPPVPPPQPPAALRGGPAPAPPPRFARTFWEQASPVQIVRGMAQTAAHPYLALTAWADQFKELTNRAQEAYKRGDYAEAGAHALNLIFNAAPGLGKTADDYVMAAGKYGMNSAEARSALGSFLGSATSMAEMGEASKRAKGAVKAGVKAAPIVRAGLKAGGKDVAAGAGAMAAAGALERFAPVGEVTKAYAGVPLGVYGAKRLARGVKTGVEAARQEAKARAPTPPGLTSTAQPGARTPLAPPAAAPEPATGYHVEGGTATPKPAPTTEPAPTPLTSTAQPAARTPAAAPVSAPTPAAGFRIERGTATGEAAPEPVAPPAPKPGSRAAKEGAGTQQIRQFAKQAYEAGNLPEEFKEANRASTAEKYGFDPRDYGDFIGNLRGWWKDHHVLNYLESIGKGSPEDIAQMSKDEISRYTQETPHPSGKSKYRPESSFYSRPIEPDPQKPGVSVREHLTEMARERAAARAQGSLPAGPAAPVAPGLRAPQPGRLPLTPTPAPQTPSVVKERLASDPVIRAKMEELAHQVTTESGSVEAGARQPIPAPAGRGRGVPGVQAATEKLAVPPRTGPSLSGTGPGGLEGVQEPLPAVPGGAGQGGQAAPGVLGNRTTVLVSGGERKAYDATYRLRELDELEASHSGQSFQENPRYKHRNDRDYTKPENQRKVVEASLPDVFEPRYFITDNPDAGNGPPIVDAAGHAFGGNGRTMILQRVYANENSRAAQAYRARLRQEASRYGLDPAQVDRMRRPVLVRELDRTENPQRAVTDFNKVGTAELRPSEKAIADSRMVAPRTLEHVANLLENAGEDASLADVLSSAGARDVFQNLVEDGVITPQEQAKYIEGDKLTPDGKSRIERLLLGRFFADTQQMDRMPASVKNRLARLAAPLVRVDALPEWTLTPKLNEAMNLIETAKSHGYTIEEELTHTNLLGTQYPPDVVTLAHGLTASKQGPLLNALRQYATDASFAARMSDPSQPRLDPMFFSQAPTPEQVRASAIERLDRELRQAAEEAAQKKNEPKSPPKSP